MKGSKITKVALNSSVELPGIDAQEFDKIINQAKEGCPVSQLFDTEITLDYTLNG